MVRKHEMGESRKVLTALALMGELISDQRQVKLKENKDADSITEAAVLKVSESSNIREICRAICEIPENQSEIELKRCGKLTSNGGLWGEFKK